MPAFRLVLLCLCALLAACVATPQGPSVQNATDERFEPVPGQAVLYIYRLGLNNNVLVIQANGRTLGESLPGTYFRVVAPPGEQIVQGVDSDQGKIQLSVPAGGIGYVRNDPYGGLSEMQSRFTIIPAGVAQKEILGCCSLLDNYAPGQRRLLF